MKKMRDIYAYLFCVYTFFSCISCNGQKEMIPQKALSPTVEATLPETLKSPTDFDPYFTGSSWVTSEYGPQNITRNILQDKNGDIWFATWEGLIKYDGSTFTNLTNKHKLRRFRHFTILEDRKGNIWFGTRGAGIYKYDGKSFINITTKDGLVNDEIGCFFEDRSGNIWIGTQEWISVYNGKEFTNYTTEDGLFNDDINTILEDNNGIFWIGSRGDLCRYDGTKFTKFLNNDDTPFVNVRCIIQDSMHNIWFTGNNGLWRHFGNLLTNFETKFVGYVFEDSKGNIWTSAEDQDANHWAILRYNQSTLNIKPCPVTKITSARDMFFGITEDIDGNIWFGSLRGAHRYDGIKLSQFAN